MARTELQASMLTPSDTDKLLGEWLQEPKGDSIKVGDRTWAPAPRSIELFVQPRGGNVQAAAFVGQACYAIGGGVDVAEAKRWLVYRLGLAGEPAAGSAEAR